MVWRYVINNNVCKVGNETIVVDGNTLLLIAREGENKLAVRYIIEEDSINNKDNTEYDSNTSLFVIYI